jgi:hypothetical protein
MDDIRSANTIEDTGEAVTYRKPYTTPKLIDLGKTERLIQTGHGGGEDATGGS